MKKEHDHGSCSNTDDVFRTFIGCAVRGMLHDTNSEGGSVIILVFDCGWGLAFNSNGSHWTETPDTVQRILSQCKQDLEATKKELECILKLGGA